ARGDQPPISRVDASVARAEMPGFFGGRSAYFTLYGAPLDCEDIALLAGARVKRSPRTGVDERLNPLASGTPTVNLGSKSLALRPARLRTLSFLSACASKVAS